MRSLRARADRLAEKLALLRAEVVARDPELSRAERRYEAEMELLDEATTPRRRLVLEHELRELSEPLPRPVTLRDVFRIEGELPAPVPEFPPEPADGAPAAEVLAWCCETAGLLWRWHHGGDPKPLPSEDLLGWVAENAPGMLEVTRQFLEGPRLTVVPEAPEPEVPERERGRVASLPGGDGLTDSQRALLRRYHLYVEGSSRLEHLDRLPMAMEYERLEQQRRGQVSRAGRVEETPEPYQVLGDDGLTDGQRDELVRRGRYRPGMPAAVNREILRRAGLA